LLTIPWIWPGWQDGLCSEWATTQPCNSPAGASHLGASFLSGWTVMTTAAGCRYMECVDLGQAFEDHMVAAINGLTAPRSQWPGFKEALRHRVAKDKVAAHHILWFCCLRGAWGGRKVAEWVGREGEVEQVGGRLKAGSENGRGRGALHHPPQLVYLCTDKWARD